jgi:hypothetical protein
MGRLHKIYGRGTILWHNARNEFMYSRCSTSTARYSVVELTYRSYNVPLFVDRNFAIARVLNCIKSASNAEAQDDIAREKMNLN